jgi:hypothetical protein
MKSITIKKIQDAFVGKVCTILTSTIAKTNFQDQQFADFFTGIIQSVDEDGVFAKHHITGCSNYYNWNYVVGILEEQVIEQDDPEYENIVQQITKKTENNIVSNDSSPFINPDIMSQIAKQAQEAQSKMIRKQ